MNQLCLERTIGFTLEKPTAFALCERDHLIAYPSGCVVTLFDYEKGKQVGFLVAPLVIDNTNKSTLPNHKSLRDNNLLLNSTLNLNINKSNNNAVIPKTISCLCFSKTGSYLAVGEVIYKKYIYIYLYIY